MRRRILLPLLAGDLAALLLGFAVAAQAVFNTWFPWHAPLHGEDSIWSLLGLMVTGLVVGSYLSVRMGPFGARRPSYGRAVVIVVTSLFVTMAGIVITRGYWSRPYLAWTATVWLIGSLALRLAMRQRAWSERVLIVSDEKRLVADLESSRHLTIVDLIDPSGDPPNGVLPGTTLVLDVRTILSDDMAQFVTSWSLSGAPVRSLASVYEEHLGRLPLVHIAHGWELTTPVAKSEYEPLKRFIDLFLVVVTAPLWLLLAGPIWIAIRLDSPGAAIYAQTRVGRHGKPFTLYKFRTMVDNAEEAGPRFAARADPRLTRVGRWLRRFRMDEIPQLWCVLKGELSLIGPRPERPYFAEQFEHAIPFFAYRTLVRPGVTGWAQVNYGYADDVADTVEKLTFDLYYVKHMSIWLDLQILGRSVWTVLSGFGAR
ncbi:MAG TPA: sugar transferase [Acidimicrobiia bacterium]|nr:sugar transferase [Acidimicrobiia bacterium]